jgi:signal transduction histidine kinase
VFILFLSVNYDCVKNIVIFISLFLIHSGIVSGQQFHIDSLNNLIKEANLIQNDTAKLIRLRTIGRIYSELNPDSSFHFSEQALTLARQLHLRLDEGDALREMGYALLNKGNYPRALQTLLSAIAILEDSRNEQNALVGRFAGDDEIMFRSALPHAQRLSEFGFACQNLAILYANSNNYEKSLQYHLLGLQNAKAAGNIIVESIIYNTINRVYLNLKKNDSAFYSIKLSYDKTMQSGYKRYLGSVLLNTGRTYAAIGDISTAIEYYKKCLTASAEQGYYRGLVAGNLLLADYYSESGKKDSVFTSITNAFSAAQKMNSPDLSLRVYTALSRYYGSRGNNDSTVKYQALIIKINDSLFNVKQAQQFQNIDFDEQQRKEELQATEKEYKNRLNIYLLLAGLVILIIVSGGLWRRNIFKQKAYALLQKQKQEIDFQKSKVEEALGELKATQSQLIQAEKMASLGELTAGIAHEIQNPLNFVNNFSEVNAELLAEVNDQIKQGDLNTLQKIVDNITDNEKKIIHHGRRADSIIKNMLMHSRSNAGQKELTDFNTLADEYLRLSYHGFRAKDKSFTARIRKDFDKQVGQVNIIPEDFGRVLLNLFNNAFYVVNENKKKFGDSYEPIVSVSTKKTDGKVEIRVRDNGGGIPQKVLDKIFQPFFTTKPAGQGTGLGLSISYDIVKAHGGEIKVESKEGEGSEFIIHLATAIT